MMFRGRQARNEHEQLAAAVAELQALGRVLAQERAAWIAEREDFRHTLHQFVEERSQSVTAVVAIAQGFGTHLVTLTDKVIELKREGFDPGPRIPTGEPPAAAPELKPLTEEDRKGWLLITEAIQDRAGEQAELAGRMTEDCHRWRALGVPYADIAKRIYAGWEG